MTQIPIIHIYSWVTFFNFCGALGRDGTSLIQKRQQNAKYSPFQLKNRREMYTQTHHWHQLWQRNFFMCHIAMLRAWSKAVGSRGAEGFIWTCTRSVLCSLCKQFTTDQELVVCDTTWIQLHPPQVYTGLPNWGISISLTSNLIQEGLRYGTEKLLKK